jgi:hypothetical protein
MIEGSECLLPGDDDAITLIPLVDAIALVKGYKNSVIRVTTR